MQVRFKHKIDIQFLTTQHKIIVICTNQDRIVIPIHPSHVHVYITLAQSTKQNMITQNTLPHWTCRKIQDCFQRHFPLVKFKVDSTLF